MESVAKGERQEKILRIALEQDLLAFCRYFFKEVLGYRMKVAEHHKLLAKTLMRVYSGEIKRLVINMPPGYTKTELAVIHFIAWALAKNPKCKFIHLTYSNVLALENSTKIRDIVTSEEFQKLWPMSLRNDTKAKGAWKTTKGGGMQARAAGGPVTGFRAGQPEEGFSGALIIDDPLKPDDATSILRVDTINNRFNGVFRSRLMKESETPIIVIMQRISDNDPSAFLLDGGMNQKFHHLNLPALIDSKAKGKKYKSRIKIKHALEDGPLWQYKHDKAELANLEVADPYTYAAQYNQEPVPLGGGIFKESWFQYYRRGSVIFEYIFITADTAQKTKEKNDYSVFQCWGVFKGCIYLIDMIWSKWEAPELEANFVLFWRKHYNPSSTTARLRFAGIEDKSSGTGLIQKAKRETKPPIPIKAIQRSVDKVSRAMDTAPYIASGKVFLPIDAPFTLDFKAQMIQFTAAMTHRYDDMVDACMDAVDLGLMPAKKKGGTW